MCCSYDFVFAETLVLRSDWRLGFTEIAAAQNQKRRTENTPMRQHYRSYLRVYSMRASSANTRVSISTSNRHPINVSVSI